MKSLRFLCHSQYLIYHHFLFLSCFIHNKLENQYFLWWGRLRQRKRGF